VKKLQAKQQVKTSECVWCDEIFVHTLKSFHGDDVEGYNKSIDHGESEAWTLKSPYCLTSNYPGKAEAIEKKKRAFDDAAMLADGEQVEIEGQSYTVRIIGLKYSDPIKFFKN
jgi:L-rhamnose isomerase